MDGSKDRSISCYCHCLINAIWEIVDSHLSVALEYLDAALGEEEVAGRPLQLLARLDGRLRRVVAPKLLHHSLPEILNKKERVLPYQPFYNFFLEQGEIRVTLGKTCKI